MPERNAGHHPNCDRYHISCYARDTSCPHPKCEMPPGKLKNRPSCATEETPFSEKSVHDQLIALLAKQLNLTVPTVHQNMTSGEWRSVHAPTGSSDYGVSLFAKESGKIAVPVLGWTTPRRARIIALHLLVAAEEVDDEQTS